MGRSPDEIVACAEQLELLLRGKPSRERIENACVLVDSLQPDLADQELAALAVRFSTVAETVGRNTKHGPVPPNRLYSLALRLKIVTEAARRRQRSASNAA